MNHPARPVAAPDPHLGTQGAADDAALRALVTRYLDALYHADPAALAPLFHPQAVYATAAGESPVVLSVTAYLAVLAGREPPSRTRAPRDEAVLAIDVVGPTTALVKLRCQFFGKRYVDLLTLLRVDGRWQIIAKVFHFDTIAA